LAAASVEATVSAEAAAMAVTDNQSWIPSKWAGPGSLIQAGSFLSAFRILTWYNRKMRNPASALTADSRQHKHAILLDFGNGSLGKSVHHTFGNFFCDLGLICQFLDDLPELDLDGHYIVAETELAYGFPPTFLCASLEMMMNGNFSWKVSPPSLSSHQSTITPPASYVWSDDQRP
jgi:hypothetical protein